MLAPAPARTEPPCPYFGRCGGCAYQHMTYAHQLEVKTRQVREVLRRLGGLDQVTVHPIVPSPLPFAYRNRITVHAENGVVGYFRHDAHQLLDITHCPIARPEVNGELAALRARHPRDGHYTLRAHGGPRVFVQTNDAVADALALFVAGAFPEGGPLLIDAYCGTGFFTKTLRSRFERVIGLEWDRFAVAAARTDVAPNESYQAGDVDELLPRVLAQNPPAVSLLLDPPATGLSPRARASILRHVPAKIVYVSCNPATLARDLRELRARYAIQSVTPFDMFPQTAEIECVAVCSADG